MTTENKAKLFGKMAQVMSKVRTLEKTGRNQFDKYDYVTADAIATKLGSAMAEAGLALFPSIIGVETSDYATKSGDNNFRTVVHMQITIACSETGATWTSDWFGEAIDRSDKSISKAAVSAVKYFLLKTFLLAGGDEEDADSQSPVVDAPGRSPAPRTLDGTNGTPKRAPSPTTPATKDAAPTDEEHDIMSQWGSPTEAQSWAIMVGACANEFEARNSFKNLVDAEFGGKFTTGNKSGVYLAWIRKVQGKLQQAQAA